MNVATASVAPASATPNASKALTIGVAGLAVSLIGLFTGDLHAWTLSYLIGVGFWVAITIGMLLLVMIHHIFDASWSVILRRQFEHALTAFLPLALLFLPLVILSILKPGTVWPWMNPETPLHSGHGTVGTDVLYLKKSAFLSVPMFIGATVGMFAVFIWLSSRLRKASFTQDTDGDLRWTRMNRVTSAFGIPLTAVFLTAAAIYWFKSLEYHWFSTMYGVWFFANCVRGALSIGVLMLLWLYARGDFKGILNKNHLHSIGQLVFAFTVFWAYVTFSQYFLIWNANIPEETFWYNLREINADGATNQWKWVGMLILFGHFFLPFLYLLSYKNKVTPAKVKPIVIWILAIILIDLCYNVLPALRDEHGNAEPFLSMNLVWTLATVVGVGGIWLWSYLRSFPTTKLIPIRDPRIGECLTHHE
ncbi:hypothetical protein [Nibricoccus sp. IMCC34717]|uniref:hypothetical protein n=1 Tax=Nibricoccus sp. IMCC34717 TaxID=3034021 RepID=UPI00384F6D57